MQTYYNFNIFWYISTPLCHMYSTTTYDSFTLAFELNYVDIFVEVCTIQLLKRITACLLHFWDFICDFLNSFTLKFEKIYIKLYKNRYSYSVALFLKITLGILDTGYQQKHCEYLNSECIFGIYTQELS